MSAVPLLLLPGCTAQHRAALHSQAHPFRYCGIQLRVFVTTRWDLLKSSLHRTKSQLQLDLSASFVSVP